MTEMQPHPSDHDHAHHDGHRHAADDGEACRHAHDHRHHAAEALARAERICGERGLRLTPIRRQALEALHGDHRPVGAYDLADRISPPGGRRLAPISIYRALDFLVEQGFVHRLSSRNAYLACLHGHGADEVVAFLICEGCGGVDEDSSPAMRKAVAAITTGRQFAASHQVVEIVGRCEHCRSAKP
ncbi:transcriptional repressor [Bosea sp. PAMC 26642]|uniref:transcriptional repressor n=1 Tax=Bosea sp. (strain PAMC 26642) TaxID=1792307 RepID=UPI001F00CF18|nr:transcriptional repressor [Bosea sp. PAMC 26642]